jgi:hypothetical protein
MMKAKEFKQIINNLEDNVEVLVEIQEMTPGSSWTGNDLVTETRDIDIDDFEAQLLEGKNVVIRPKD